MTAPTTIPGAPTEPLTPAQRGRRKTLVLVGVLALAVGVGVLPAYTGLDPSTSRVDVSTVAPWHYAALLVHIPPAGIALVVGPLQFSATVQRHRRTHRALGRVYAGSVVLASLGGAVVGALSTAGPTAWVGFVLLDVLWATTTVAGWRAARQHRYLDHAVWMTRSYALTFAGVTLRLWLVLLVLALQPLRDSYFHGDGDQLMTQAYLVTPWLSWVPNLIIAEQLVARLRRREPRSGRSGHSITSPPLQRAGRRPITGPTAPASEAGLPSMLLGRAQPTIPPPTWGRSETWGASRAPPPPGRLVVPFSG